MSNWSDPDDGWTPSQGTQLEDIEWSAAAQTVTGGIPTGPRLDPRPHWLRPWFSSAYRALRCGACGFSWGGHRAANRIARAELAHRRGKQEEPCPRCLGSGSYIDADGRHPWRVCPRCEGWGAIWERKA